MTTSTNTTRQALRIPAAAMLAGQALYIAITQLHAAGNANDHHHIFETYGTTASGRPYTWGSSSASAPRLQALPLFSSRWRRGPRQAGS